MPRFGSLLLAAVAALAIGAGAGLSFAAEPGPPIAPDQPPALASMHFDETPLAEGAWTANDAYENRASWADGVYQNPTDDSPPAPAPSSPAGTTATWLVLGWAILTMLVNTLFHACTPKDVDAWAERNPRLAWIAALFRRAGIEPIAILTLLARFFAANPPPPAAMGGNAAMGKKHPYRDASVCDACKGRGYGGGAAPFLGALAFVCVLLAPLSACKGSAFPDVASLASCEADLAHDHPALDFEDFVVLSVTQCGPQGARVVEDVVHAILGSSDPNLAQYKPAAEAAQRDPAKMGALRAKARRP
jgi:hypothetical protein